MRNQIELDDRQSLVKTTGKELERDLLLTSHSKLLYSLSVKL